MSKAKVKNKDDRIIRKMLRQVMIVSSLSGIVTVMGALIDTIVIGKFLGGEAVAAAGLFNAVLLFCIAISSVFSGGGQIYVTRKLGEAKKDEANAYFSGIMVAIVIVSAVIGILMFALSPQIAGIIGGNKAPEILHLTTDYVRGVSIGIPALMIMFCTTAYIQLDGNQKILFIAMAAMVVVNVSGDLLNVLVFKGGLFGIALATSASNIVGFLIAITHFISKHNTFKVSFKAIRMKFLGDVIAAGFPTALQRIYSAVANLLMNYIVLSVVGVIGGTAQGVRGNVSALFLTVGSSLGGATMAVASLMYGEENADNLKKTASASVIMSAKVTTVMAIIMFVFAEMIAGMFLKDNAAALEMATRSIRFFAFAVPFSSICDILFGYYRAISMNRIANVIPFCEYLLFPVGLSYILGHTPLNDNGIWVAYPIAEVLAILVAIIVVSIKIRRVAFKPSDWALIPEGFGVKEGDSYETVVEDLEGVVKASDEAAEFCESKTRNEDKIYKTRLVVEELCSNIVEHDFDSVKNPHIELRVFWKNDKITICIRDNCKKFNLKEDKLANREIGDFEHLGIPLIFKAVPTLEYNYVLNTNNVRVEL